MFAVSSRPEWGELRVYLVKCCVPMEQAAENVNKLEPSPLENTELLETHLNSVIVCWTLGHWHLFSIASNLCESLNCKTSFCFDVLSIYHPTCRVVPYRRWTNYSNPYTKSNPLTPNNNVIFLFCSFFRTYKTNQTPRARTELRNHNFEIRGM